MKAFVEIYSVINYYKKKMLKSLILRFLKTTKLFRRECSQCKPSQCFLIVFFYITVTKFIRIGIADKNDNPPYFDKALYEAEVDENEDIQHTVLTVTAKDHDECKSFLLFIIRIQKNINIFGTLCTFDVAEKLK